MAKTPLSLNALRTILSDTLGALRDDSVGVDHCNAVSNIAGKHLNTYRIQMEYQRLIGARRPIKGLEDAE